MKKISVLWGVGVIFQCAHSTNYSEMRAEVFSLAKDLKIPVSRNKGANPHQAEYKLEIPNHPIDFGSMNVRQALEELKKLKKNAEIQRQQPHLSFTTASVFNQANSPAIQTRSLNRADVGTNANPDLEKALVDTKRPNESWSKKQLQEFIEEKSDKLKIIHRDQPDEKTEVGINDNIVWNNELSSFDDYLLCAQRLYDALGFLTK